MIALDSASTSSCCCWSNTYKEYEYNYNTLNNSEHINVYLCVSVWKRERDRDMGWKHKRNISIYIRTRRNLAICSSRTYFWLHSFASYNNSDYLVEGWRTTITSTSYRQPLTLTEYSARCFFSCMISSSCSRNLTASSYTNGNSESFITRNMYILHKVHMFFYVSIKNQNRWNI